MNPLLRHLDRLDRKQGSSVVDAAFPRRLGGRLLLAGRAPSWDLGTHDEPARHDRQNKNSARTGGSRSGA